MVTVVITGKPGCSDLLKAACNMEVYQDGRTDTYIGKTDDLRRVAEGLEKLRGDNYRFVLDVVWGPVPGKHEST